MPAAMRRLQIWQPTVTKQRDPSRCPVLFETMLFGAKPLVMRFFKHMLAVKDMNHFLKSDWGTCFDMSDPQIW